MRQKSRVAKNSLSLDYGLCDVLNLMLSALKIQLYGSHVQNLITLYIAGYKFDDRKPDSPVLKICFAHFPFRLPSHQDDQ